MILFELETLPGINFGDIQVTKAGNTYLIELLNSDLDISKFTLDASGLTASFVNAVNEIQQVTVNATGGTFLLALPDALVMCTPRRLVIYPAAGTAPHTAPPAAAGSPTDARLGRTISSETVLPGTTSMLGCSPSQ